ncbi:MAG TPA: hypothetical protein VHU44_00695 [Acidobacteriaceae bacterium]|jgi:hypothetical protein|nr:hypothetical protein [Acidobacteriaceae bacterium]
MASAHKEDESLKKHGDVMDRALEDLDRHGVGTNVDPIPMPERGSHEKSHAAHPGGTVHDHTKRAGDLRKSVDPGERRESPQEIGRIGKEHRKQ